jgi:hypothetical protein
VRHYWREYCRWIGRILPLASREEGPTMVRFTEMLKATTNTLTIDGAVLAACVEACFSCAQTCTTCADACLADMPGEMGPCIAQCTNCADLCMTAGRVLSRPSQGGHNAALIRDLLRACLEATRICLAECAGHADDMEVCRLCADSCQNTQQRCADILEVLAVAT